MPTSQSLQAIFEQALLADAAYTIAENGTLIEGGNAQLKSLSSTTR